MRHESVKSHEMLCKSKQRTLFRKPTSSTNRIRRVYKQILLKFSDLCMRQNQESKELKQTKLTACSGMLCRWKWINHQRCIDALKAPYLRGIRRLTLHQMNNLLTCTHFIWSAIILRISLSNLYALYELMLLECSAATQNLPANWSLC